VGGGRARGRGLKIRGCGEEKKRKQRRGGGVRSLSFGRWIVLIREWGVVEEGQPFGLTAISPCELYGALRD